MSQRLVDGRRIKVARIKAGLLQSQVGKALGVSDSAEANWENGKKRPDAELLPALAEVLGKPLDVLFPREGLPDLADLRADAGIYQKDTGQIIGTKSHAPVSRAERGIRRLDPKYVPPLAAAYGVSVDSLLAAQERSFGRDVPEPGQVPTSLAGKIAFLMEHLYPGAQVAPTADEIARGINEWAGAAVVSEEEVKAILSGAQPTAKPIVYHGLADFFGVEPLFFEPQHEVARHIYEGLRLLALAREGKVTRAVVHGAGEGGLPADVLAFVNEVVVELQDRGLPAAGDEGQ
ncbi:DNA-binding XRE family transcriptional regulator [Streptomyces puniciscabiei]|uniref:DNA-binding XRE family transcriptional regulator n=1 Tax=Streptomyces puniciscabiei TaxID=164348 RepID=A0A542UJ14_9ACTN|nr:helix-turn-helix transcriptional regulator [Streptomyces puniciscabiei]TQK99053.1 DNA-binding XRE family transcriptional regulator [Streptomyces puniciscabiei]